MKHNTVKKIFFSVCLLALAQTSIANKVSVSQSMVSDKEYLKRDQYNNSSNYQRRLEVFKYGNKPPLLEWAAQEHHQIYSLNDKKILELGSGTCEFWEHVLTKTNLTKANLTLTDISQGMLNDCEKHISKFTNAKDTIKIKYDLTDIDHLEKYSSNSFDVIIAHFVIYHAKDPHKALKELHRILKPSGFLALGIVDEDSSKGLWALGNQIDARVPTKGFTSIFCEKHIENKSLLKNYSNCSVSLYQNRLQFDLQSKHIPINSFRTSPTIAGLNLNEAVYAQMDQRIVDDIQNKGVFEYDYLARIYFCRK